MTKTRQSTIDELLKIIRDLEKKDGRYPTRPMIAKVYGRKRQMTYAHLKNMERDGYIEIFDVKESRVKYITKRIVKICQQKTN